MTTCPNCKREVPDNTQYCPFCATDLTTPTTTEEMPTLKERMSSVAKLYDIIGFIGWATMILGFIAALIVGNELAYYDFNWPIFLGIFAGSVVTGILFLAIKKHLVNQERTIELLEEIANKK